MSDDRESRLRQRVIREILSQFFESCFGFAAAAASAAKSSSLSNASSPEAASISSRSGPSASSSSPPPPPRDTLTVFHSAQLLREHEVGRYVRAVARALDVSDTVLVVALAYMNRVETCAHVSVNAWTVLRLWLASVLVALKFSEDAFVSMSAFARVCGVSVAELARLELALCAHVGFQLYVSTEQFNMLYAMLAAHVTTPLGARISQRDRVAFAALAPFAVAALDSAPLLAPPSPPSLPTSPENEPSSHRADRMVVERVRQHTSAASGNSSASSGLTDDIAGVSCSASAGGGGEEEVESASTASARTPVPMLLT